MFFFGDFFYPNIKATEIKNFLISACFICIEVFELRSAESLFCIPTYNKAFHWTHVCSKNSHKYKLIRILLKTHFTPKPDETLNKGFDRNRRNKFESD